MPRSWAVPAYAVLVALMYAPYAVLREAAGWSLYLYWTIVALAALATAWAATAGWSKNGG